MWFRPTTKYPGAVPGLRCARPTALNKADNWEA